MREPSFTVWLTGPERAPLEALADDVARCLAGRHVPVEVLDSRTPGIGALAGAGAEARTAFVAGALARHGVAVVVALAAPRRADRDRARAELGRMIEVYVHRSAEVALGDYEAPVRPEVEIVVPEPSPSAGAERVLRTLEVLGLLARDTEAAYSEDEEREVIRRLKAFGYL